MKLYCIHIFPLVIWSREHRQGIFSSCLSASQCHPSIHPSVSGLLMYSLAGSPHTPLLLTHPSSLTLPSPLTLPLPFTLPLPLTHPPHPHFTFLVFTFIIHVLPILSSSSLSPPSFISPPSFLFTARRLPSSPLTSPHLLSPPLTSSHLLSPPLASVVRGSRVGSSSLIHHGQTMASLSPSAQHAAASTILN